MTSTEFAERRVMPLVVAFALGALVMHHAAERQLQAERQAAVHLLAASERLEHCVRRVLDAIEAGTTLPEGCTPALPGPGYAALRR